MRVRSVLGRWSRLGTSSGLVAALTLVALAFIVQPAEAKGDGFVVITGPGLSRPVEISFPADTSSYWWLTGVGELYRDHPPPATTFLGPRYRVGLVYWDEGAGSSRHAIVQDLYPASSDGVIWTDLPRGQRWDGTGEAVLPGWWGTVNWELSELLGSLGFQSLGSFDPPDAAAGRWRLG